jgi:hypothetical protein
MFFLEVSREDIASNGSGVDTVFAPSQLHDNGGVPQQYVPPLPSTFIVPLQLLKWHGLEKGESFLSSCTEYLIWL